MTKQKTQPDRKNVSPTSCRPRLLSQEKMVKALEGINYKEHSNEYINHYHSRCDYPAAGCLEYACAKGQTSLGYTYSPSVTIGYRTCRETSVHGKRTIEQMRSIVRLFDRFEQIYNLYKRRIGHKTRASYREKQSDEYSCEWSMTLGIEGITDKEDIPRILKIANKIEAKARLALKDPQFKSLRKDSKR